ncbi:hypothetical protein VHEMI10753 [[Torrubiella] hemipterigena]|uniref:Transposase-like protein n=1 Tax=[Torrubiella] hemipterigena TaxID=1531966 RepID=A0A0A1TSS0_9HYPO|nr:hypothetical protein VHEMI10753 [[Torrubiella] hemipterigena]
MSAMIDQVSDDLEREFKVYYDPLPHRLRCLGHIMNLAVMEFLIGKRLSTTGVYLGLSIEQIEEWRKRGAIGKLHNIMTPRRDNDTRWNSWYKMVETALRPKVRQAITIFYAQELAL